MSDIENHMVTREDKPTSRDLENKLILLSKAVGFLEYVQGMVSELQLGAAFALSVQQALNERLTMLFDLEDECARHPDFKLRTTNGDFDYFGFAKELARKV